MWEELRGTMLVVAASLQQRLGKYLRKRRGELTYEQFARKVGISKSTLQRMELGQQNVTLVTLGHLLKQLKCSAGEVFDGPPSDNP